MLVGGKAWTLGWIKNYKTSLSRMCSGCISEALKQVLSRLTFLLQPTVSSTLRKLPQSAAWAAGFENTVTQWKPAPSIPYLMSQVEAAAQEPQLWPNQRAGISTTTFNDRRFACFSAGGDWSTLQLAVGSNVIYIRCAFSCCWDVH